MKAQQLPAILDVFEKNSHDYPDYILVIQRFRVVYHEISLVFYRYTHEPLGECAIVCEKTSDKWDIPWYTKRKCVILHHAIENTTKIQQLFLGGNRIRNARWECRVEYRRIDNGFPEF